MKLYQVHTMQVLAYPVLDPALAAPSCAKNATGRLLTTQQLDWYWTQYLGDAHRRHRSPPRRCTRSGSTGYRRPSSSPLAPTRLGMTAAATPHA